MPLKKTYCLLVLLSLFQMAASAQSFRAALSYRSISKDETVQLTLTFENPGKITKVTPPSLKDFIVLGPPMQETSYNNFNGQSSKTFSITYLLRPKKTGNFTFAPATATVDGKDLTAKTLYLEVTAGSGKAANVAPQQSNPFSGFMFEEAQPEPSYDDFILKTNENLQDKINKNLFIRVEPSKTSCFVGEPIIVTYKLYTRLKSSSNVIKPPAFNGFSVIDLMRSDATYTIEKLNGRSYNVYVLRKSQLYPLQAGAAELEPAEVDNDIRFVKEAYAKNNKDELAADLMRDYGMPSIPAEAIQDEKITIRSKPVTIDVKPLPEAGKPADFKGAVGIFDIDDVLDKTNFTTTEACKLKIRISGEGNLSLITSPDINWPGSIEGFEPTSYESLNKLNFPVKGAKYFDYSFTVAQPGTYTIPPIKFSFFNPQTSRYDSSVTDPINITVTKGVPKAYAAGDSLNGRTGKEAFFEKIFTQRGWIIGPVVAFIFIGLLVWIRRENKKEKNEQSADLTTEVVEETLIDKIDIKPLALSEERLLSHDVTGFYAALNVELRTALSNCLGIEPDKLNKKNIAEEADKKGIDVLTSMQIQQLLADIELQLYTPYADDDKMPELYARASTIVHALQHC